MKKKHFLLALLGGLFIFSCNDPSTLTIYGSSSVASLSDEGQETAGSPTSMKLSLYAAWVCRDSACTDCTQVTDNGNSPVEKNTFGENPIFFEGNPADGTYECIVMKISDAMKFIPDDEAVEAFPEYCSTEVEYTYDIYRAGESDSNLWKDNEGKIIPATGTPDDPSAVPVYIFVSTDPTSVDAHPHQTITLASPLVVPGQATFVVDFTDQVSSALEHCWLETPTMSFE